MCLPWKWHIKSKYPLKFNWLTKMGEWKLKKNEKKKEKMNEEKKMIVTSCTKIFNWVQNREKGRRKSSFKFLKKCFFLSLRNYSSVRWLCLRWQTAIFHYLFTDLENYSFATPFELNNFSFWTPTKDHPPHWRAYVEERQFQRSWKIGSCFKKMPMLKGKCAK